MTEKNEIVKTEDNAVAVIEAEPKGTGEITKIAEVHDDKVLVTAQHPAHMQECNKHLIELFGKRAVKLQAEADELQVAYEHAKKNRWQTKPLKRQAERTLKRVEYYKKIKSALEAGYCIVPNFPVSLFAIRTTRKKPLRYAGSSAWYTHEQGMETNAEGEGKWVSDRPIQDSEHWEEENEKGNMVKKALYFASDHDDVEFPITMAKPEIMQAASGAMQRKIFDGLGILPAARRLGVGDPMICGMIKDPKSTTHNIKCVTFVVAWHLDTDQI